MDDYRKTEPKILKAPKFQPSGSNKPKIKIQVSSETKKIKQKKLNNEVPFVEIAEETNPGISVQTQPLDSSQKTTTPIIKPSQIVVKDGKEELFNLLLGRLGQENKQLNSFEKRAGKDGQDESFQKNFDFIENDTSKPLSKDELYQELIALEGKKYAIEKTRKKIKIKHEKGNLTNEQFITATERIKYDLEHISGKINDAREKIQAL